MTKLTEAVTMINSPRRYLIEKKKTANLENIIKECIKTRSTWGLMQNDVIFAVAFWSMMECGFVSVTSEGPKIELENKDGRVILPKNWKHGTRQLYEAQFCLPPYLQYPVKLVAFPADDILCINVLVSNISPRIIRLRSLAIPTSDYVSKAKEDASWFKSCYFEDFYFLLRNAIIWPIRCSILTEQGILNGSLCGLSDEIKLKIIQNLALVDILNLSQACRDLNRICNDESVWKGLFHKAFYRSCSCSGQVETCTETFDWKKKYKELYRKNKEMMHREGSIAHPTPESNRSSRDYENEERDSI